MKGEFGNDGRRRNAGDGEERKLFTCIRVRWERKANEGVNQDDRGSIRFF